MPALPPCPCCSDALAFDAATCQTSCQASQFALATVLALSQAIQQCGCDKPAIAVAQVEWVEALWAAGTPSRAHGQQSGRVAGSFLQVVLSSPSIRL